MPPTGKTSSTPPPTIEDVKAIFKESAEIGNEISKLLIKRQALIDKADLMITQIQKANR